MRLLLTALMLCLLLRAQTVMAAASDACRLFVAAVLPGLLPYMTLALMLAGRFAGGMPAWGVLLLGWGGGSPAGARLLRSSRGLTRRQQVRLAVSTATMSPMFLLGTCGGWLGSARAGAVLLGSVLAGGWLAGQMAGAFVNGEGTTAAPQEPASPLSLGEAVEQAARTMLLVCGTMVMLRVFAALAAELLPAWSLPLMTALEVTSGAVQLAALPWPLPLRTAAIAGATGFGGMAIVMQNRAAFGRGSLPLPVQLLWQAVHGALSFLIALGAMLLSGS